MSDSRVIRTLLRFTRPYPWALPALVVLGVLGSLAEGVGIGLLIPLLDALIGDGPSAPSGPFASLMQQAAGWLGGETQVALLGGLIILLITLKSLILVANVALATRLNGRVTHDLRRALHRRVLEVDYGHFARSDHGHLLSVLNRQTDRTSEALAYLSVLIGAACTLLVFTALLLLISWPLTLTVVVGVLIVSRLVGYMQKRASRYGNEFVEAYGGLTGRIVETLTHMRTIRLFGQEAAEDERFRQRSEAVRRAFVRSQLTAEVIPPTSELLYLPLFLAVLLMAWQLGIGLSSLFAFLVLLYRMQPPLKNLDHARVTLGTFTAAVREVAALREARATPARPSGGRPFDRLEREIVLDGVTFRYHGAGDGPPAVADVGFRIGRGEVVAIVGGSGAGKSTLVHLLCRLYDPDGGEIRVDGVPLAQIDLAAWRARLAFAGQDAELMSGSVRDNIAYGCPLADQTAVEQAARLAHADRFIDALPQGYDTLVGPRGLSLSGGQRQRVALARALLRRPELLILDEATNALDGMSEQAIQETVAELRGRLTILLIAHRLSTVRQADRVVAMTAGRVVEQGRPQELLRSGGLYARLHALELAAPPTAG